MPKGRFVAKKIAVDPKLNQLDDTTFLFFLMLIPHLDAEGRMWGDAVIVKGACCPYRDWTVAQVDNMLSSLEAIKRQDGLGVVERYKRDGHNCLWMAGFEGEQRGLQKDHEAKGKYGYSDVPPPPDKLLKLRDGNPDPETKPKPTKAEQPIDQTGIADEKLADMVAYYRDQIGDVTPAIFENLKLWCDEFDIEDYKRMVDQAKGRKVKHPLRYIETSLNNLTKDLAPKTTEGEDNEAESDFGGDK